MALAECQQRYLEAHPDLEWPDQKFNLRYVLKVRDKLPSGALARQFKVMDDAHTVSEQTDPRRQ